VNTINDQIWFKLRTVPGIHFGAIYIPPRDSPYYNPQTFANLQEHCYNENVIALGDYNSRMGNLDVFSRRQEGIVYTENPDTVTNTNGKELISLCSTNNLLPINHITVDRTSGANLTGEGKLTFRKKERWISQIDWAIMTAPLLKFVESFTIQQDLSLPTDHASLSLKLTGFQYPAGKLLAHAKELGKYDAAPEDNMTNRKPISSKEIDRTKLLNNLQLPIQIDNVNIDSLCEELASNIYTASRAARNRPKITRYNSPQNSLNRWNNILRNGNDRQLWSAINWQGNLRAPLTTDDASKPNDNLFCAHFQALLNPDNVIHPQDYDAQEYRYIPILDDPIRIEEVDRCLQKMKTNKAAGTDGISPGILKMLPATWLALLTYFFNVVFNNQYPLQWSLMRVFTIYKKGNRIDPSNYRGISILSAIPKLYDMILSTRFSLWYTPRVEQAGAQPGRSCEEQILTVRLVIDIARKMKRTLYIAFIDYQKAYDKVNRYKLLQYLDHRGCGNIFLNALKHSMTSTGQIGKAQFTTTAGVKQGGSSSCNLFTAYIDPTIDAVKEFGPDDWLGHLQILLLMDDTIIFATSRLRLLAKLRLLKTCADDIGMTLHPTKSKFLTVNCEDNVPFVLDDVSISKTEQYVYLGAEISNQPIASQVKNHIKSKASHTRKFYSFLSKNSDCPFPVKVKVWKSALNTAILYSCETWLTNDLRSVESSYNNTLKQMLSCRQTTCNDIVYLETGQPNAKSVIMDKQIRFLKKLRTREDYITDIINLAIRTKSPMGNRIAYLSSLSDTQTSMFISNLKDSVHTSESSRRVTYRKINPNLTPSKTLVKLEINELDRIAATRLRLGSHYLRVETGRWSRTPPDERICACNTGIQDEEHVLLNCPLSHHLRAMNNFNFNSLSELFEHDVLQVAEYCKDIINLYRT